MDYVVTKLDLNNLISRFFVGRASLQIWLHTKKLTNKMPYNGLHRSKPTISIVYSGRVTSTVLTSMVLEAPVVPRRLEHVGRGHCLVSDPYYIQYNLAVVVPY